MKSGSVFWGSFLIGIGVLFFLDRYDIFFVNTFLFRDFWPIILIFLGALIILQEKVFKPILTGIFGLFAAVLVFSVFNFSSCSERDYDYDRGYSNTNEYYKDYDSEITSAHLKINTGAGYFELKGETDKLIFAESGAKNNNYEFSTREVDSTAFIEFNYEKEFKFWDKNNRNKLKIRLNPNPVWRFEFNIGAAKSDFDFRSFKARKIIFNTGATHSVLKIGDRCRKTYIEINAGAAEVEIRIPRESGCKLAGDNFLIAKNVPRDMKKDGDGYYVSGNYYEADNQIIVVVDGAAASIKIKRD